MDPFSALLSTGGGGFSGSSSSNTGAASFHSAFDNSGFVVNQGAPTWLVYAAIGAAVLGVVLALRRR